MRGFDRATLRADLVAGGTTAVMLVPQAMAYALLAGLPPIVGLYAAVVAPLAYAISGSSRELAVGPVAMDSLLTAVTVGALAQVGSEHYVALATMLAGLAGATQVALGLLRGGFLVNFLSRPVVSGFTSATAVVIAASQVREILGLDLPRSTSVVAIAAQLIPSLPRTHLPTLAIAVVTIVALGVMKRWVPKWPRALLVVVVGIAAVWSFGLDQAGVRVVGEVPAGLPSPRWPDVDVADVRALAVGALTIAFVGFMEGISVTTKFADRRGERARPNREFVALGLANLAAGAFGGYPVAGGFARSAVHADAGARTKFAGVVTAVGVAVTLAFFTPILRFVPKATLGAIIVAAVVGLVDVAEPRRLWRIKRADLAMLGATFVATLTLGIVEGILLGIGASMLLFVVRTTRPHYAVLGRLPGTEVYRNVLRYPEAVQRPGILAVRLDAQLYYGNVTFVHDTLARLETEASAPLRRVVLDASGINQLDSSAEQELRDLFRAYRARGIDLVLASVKGPVRDVLDRSGLSRELGADGIVFRVHDAFEATGNLLTAAADTPRT